MGDNLSFGLNSKTVLLTGATGAIGEALPSVFLKPVVVLQW